MVKIVRTLSCDWNRKKGEKTKTQGKNGKNLEVEISWTFHGTMFSYGLMAACCRSSLCVLVFFHFSRARCPSLTHFRIGLYGCAFFAPVPLSYAHSLRYMQNCVTVCRELCDNSRFRFVWKNLRAIRTDMPPFIRWLGARVCVCSYDFL